MRWTEGHLAASQRPWGRRPRRGRSAWQACGWVSREPGRPRRLHRQDRRGAGTGSPSPRPWTLHLASDGAKRRCSDGTAGRRQRSAGGWAARSRRVSEYRRSGGIEPTRPRGGKGAPAERTHLITDTALTHLQQFGETDEPFFLWLHYVNPHRPYTPPAEYQPRFIDDSYFDASVRLPHTGGHVGGIRTGVYVEGEHRLAYYVAQYDSETRFADDQIGAVLGALRAQSALANTLVVLTADHGEGLGEQDVYFKHGPYVLESHVRVPLIIHHPTRTSSPRRVQRPVGIIDVVPTVLDMAGISEPTFQGPRLEHPLAGQSLASVRDGELDGHRQDIFFASRNYWGIRSGDWKLILETREAKGNVGSSHQLFNLREDPEENVNVYDATDDQSARVLRRLEARRQIQTFAGSDEDWDARSKELSEEALENLRILGYIR